MKAFAPFTIVVMSVAALLLFGLSHELKLDQFGRDAMAALYGAVMTMMITASLLSAQSHNEVQRDKSVGVFQEKLQLFTAFCEFLNRVARDGQLSDSEEEELRLWAMKLSLISRHEVTDSLDQFFVQTHRYKKLRLEDFTEEEKADLVEHGRKTPGGSQSRKPEDHFMSLGELIAHLKHDLGEVEISRKRDVESCWHAIDDILGAR